MKKLWLLLMLVLALCGCDAQEEIDETVSLDDKPRFAMEEISDYPVLELQNDGAESIGHLELATELGTFRIEIVETPEGRQDDLLVFDDPVSGVTYPLCVKVNCSHDSPECGAYWRNAQLNRQMHYDGEYLYLVGSTDDSEGCIYRMDPDGSDQKTALIAEAAGEGHASVTSIDNCIFQDKTVYFALHTTKADDGLVGHITQFCVGDLTTGEYTILPGRYNDSWLLGLCGRELIVMRTTGGESERLEDFLEEFFLLNIDTGEISVMLEVKGGDRSYSCDPAAGWLYLIKDDGYDYWTLQEDIPVTNDPEIEKFTTNTGDRYFVDIPNRKVYKWSDVELFYKDHGRGGYWVYLKWNEDHTAVTRYVRSIETGEEFLYNEIFP